MNPDDFSTPEEFEAKLNATRIKEIVIDIIDFENEEHNGLMLSDIEIEKTPSDIWLEEEEAGEHNR